MLENNDLAIFFWTNIEQEHLRQFMLRNKGLAKKVEGSTATHVS